MMRIESNKFKNGYLKYDHLLGHEFIHGEQDCYEILRKVYKDNLEIELTSYARPDDWWIQNMNLYTDNFVNEGFFLVDIKSVQDINLMDVLLVALPDSRSPTYTVPNHCLIYVGEGKVLHHRLGKLSQVIPYKGMYRNFTTHVLRHKDVPKIEEHRVQKLDLMDYILPHKRELLMGAQNDKS